MLINKFRHVLCLFTAIIIICFPVSIQAETTFVLECPDEDAECDENLGEVDEINADQKKSVKKEESLVFKMIKMFFALLLVLALIYVLLKFLNKRTKLFGQVKALENIGGIPVGQNKSIQIVRIGTNVYMIGVGDNVELLQEITDEDLKKELLHKNEENEFQASNLFKSIGDLKSSRARSTENKTTKFENLFSKELDKLKQTRNKIKHQHKQKEDTHE